jgi:hypothetical protein
MADSKNLKFDKQINRSKNPHNGFVTRDCIGRKGLTMREKINIYWEKRKVEKERFKRRFK